MASYQVKVDLIFGEKGIVRGALESAMRLSWVFYSAGMCPACRAKDASAKQVENTKLNNLESAIPMK